MISRWPEAEVHFVARSLDPVRCDCGLTVIPTDTPETFPNPDLIVVPGSENPLPATVAELDRLGLRPREVALDGGFPVEAANRAFPDAQVFVAGRQHPPSRRSKKRLASYRAGAEGRISHLKRRSRLKGHDGARTWTGWGILTYDLDTLTVQTP